jgi:hypothetical protein
MISRTTFFAARGMADLFSWHISKQNGDAVPLAGFGKVRSVFLQLIAADATGAIPACHLEQLGHRSVVSEEWLTEQWLIEKLAIKLAADVSQQVRPLACKKALTAALESLIFNLAEADKTQLRFDQIVLYAPAHGLYACPVRVPHIMLSDATTRA